MAKNLDDYPNGVYSLCNICRQCITNNDGSYRLNRVSSSAINVIPTSSYSCNGGFYKEGHYIHCVYSCPGFLEDKEKVGFYRKKKIRGCNKK